ncbi:MAG: hypothetical protein ACRDU8_09795 [Egibacteraceae bacterium]
MVLWWIGFVVMLAVVVHMVVLLANLVFLTAKEIRRYADDILVHGVGLSGNLDPVPVLNDTRTLVGGVTGNAVAYVTALKRLV